MDDARVPIEWTLASIDEAKEELDHGDAAGAGRDAALDLQQMGQRRAREFVVERDLLCGSTHNGRVVLIS